MEQSHSLLGAHEHLLNSAPGGGHQEERIVSSLAISLTVFACVFGGVLLGMFLRTILPEHHLSPDSKDVVKLGMGLIATMAALVLGLLVASAKNSYDTQRSGLTQMSANIMLLDRVLTHYGPETKDTRDLLRRSVVRVLDQMWPEDRSHPAQLEPTAAGAEPLYDTIQALSPQNEAQRSLQAKALGISTDIAQTRYTKSFLIVAFRDLAALSF